MTDFMKTIFVCTETPEDLACALTESNTLDFILKTIDTI